MLKEQGRGAGTLLVPGEVDARLAAASWSASSAAPFADAFLRALGAELGLTAATLWLYTADDQPLRLRAGWGLRMEAYDSFELSLDSPLGLAIGTQRVIALDSAALAAHSGIAAGLDPGATGGAVVGALTVPERAYDGDELVSVVGPIGALCLHPRRPQERAELADWLADNRDFLGQLYVAQLERNSMGFRRRIVERVAFRPDLPSLEHNFLRVAAEVLSVDAAQLWVVSPRQRVVYLHRTNGLGDEVDEDLRRPLQDTDGGPVMRCFGEQRTLVHTPSSPIEGCEELARGLPEPLANAMLVPLALKRTVTMGGEEVSCAGVLVLFNHRARIGELKHLAAATWEDGALARFSCEMLAVLMFQMLRARESEIDFEHMMHAARDSMQGSLHKLLALDCDAIAQNLPGDQRHYLVDAIFWLEDLTAQINRSLLDSHQALDLSVFNIYFKVLVKVRSMVRRMTPALPANRPVVEGLDDTIFQRNLPLVRADEGALTAVFRNLVDNSVKYSPRALGHTPMVHFDLGVSDDGAYVTVVVSDNGIGIPEEDRERIFVDHFRGVRARAHVPSGIGHGLFDCRRLLRLMNGEIALLPTPPGEVGARFQVSIPIARRARRRR